MVNFGSGRARKCMVQSDFQPVKPGVGLGDRMFALRPGHLLHPYPAARTLHPSRRIDQKHLHPPKRDELEAPGRQPIVPRAALPTARVSWGRAGG